MPFAKIRRSATGLLAEQDLLVGEHIVGEYDRRVRRVDADLHLELVRVARVGILLQRRPIDLHLQRLVDDLIAGAYRDFEWLGGEAHDGRPNVRAIVDANHVGVGVVPEAERGELLLKGAELAVEVDDDSDRVVNGLQCQIGVFYGGHVVLLDGYLDGLRSDYCGTMNARVIRPALTER